MKAALEAWGSTRNLFHHGFAKQSEDPATVAATMAKPGVVLRRPVGTNAAFSEHPELPRHLGGDKVKDSSVKRAVPAKKSTTKPVNERASRQSILAFEKEQARRERQARKEAAARDRQRQRRDRAIAAAEAALEKAKRAHDARLDEIANARAALDKESEVQESRWRVERDELESALRKARSGNA